MKYRQNALLIKLNMYLHLKNAYVYFNITFINGDS